MLNFFFINVLDNNLNNIFSFLLLLYFLSELVTFCILKKSSKTQVVTPCFDVKNLGKFFFCVFQGSSGVYIKKWAVYIQRGRRKKIGVDGCHFSEVPSLRKEISTSGLHILLLGNYMSLHSKIAPAAINIYRDITKCLTCYGFF